MERYLKLVHTEEMSTLLLMIFAALSAITLWVAAKGSVHPKDGEARVHRVLDGDTVIVKQGWRSHTIRLDAIDCPEKGQPWGGTATAGLVKLIGGKSIRLEVHTRDKYERTLATIYVFSSTNEEWLNVNARMVVLGHAWVYRRYLEHLPAQRQAELRRMENWARSRNVGLWKTSNPIPPWEWRNRGRFPKAKHFRRTGYR